MGCWLIFSADFFFFSKTEPAANDNLIQILKLAQII